MLINTQKNASLVEIVVASKLSSRNFNIILGTNVTFSLINTQKNASLVEIVVASKLSSRNFNIITRSSETMVGTNVTAQEV